MTNTSGLDTPCLKWSSISFYSQLLSLYPQIGLGNHSYCRNPLNRTKPWCYTGKDSGGCFTWEYCGIPTCNDALCYSRFDLVYNKTGSVGQCSDCLTFTCNQSRTTTGRCQFPFVYKGKEYNGCTTDERGHPWCATSIDPNNRTMTSWAYCQCLVSSNEMMKVKSLVNVTIGPVTDCLGNDTSNLPTVTSKPFTTSMPTTTTKMALMTTMTTTVRIKPSRVLPSTQENPTTAQSSLSPSSSNRINALSVEPTAGAPTSSFSGTAMSTSDKKSTSVLTEKTVSSGTPTLSAHANSLSIIPIAVGAGVGILLLIILIFVLFLLWRRKRRSADSWSKGVKSNPIYESNRLSISNEAFPSDGTEGEYAEIEMTGQPSRNLKDASNFYDRLKHDLLQPESSTYGKLSWEVSDTSKINGKPAEEEYAHLGDHSASTGNEYARILETQSGKDLAEGEPCYDHLEKRSEDK
eukprot:m.114371 g.114371  ORF g.114371 m.114371 type:complete len:463 (+) comp37492_c0_seq2:945-2333(+)